MALRSTGSEGVLREARGLPFTSAPELESLTNYLLDACAHVLNVPQDTE